MSSSFFLLIHLLAGRLASHTVVGMFFVHDWRDRIADEMQFTGVFMMASASQIWRATGGRFNSSYFQYKIGGEW